MKPLNKKERNKAFYKVVGLFLLSFLIAVIVGFSTMNVSKLSDHNMQAELKELKNNFKFQEEVFAPNVSNATDLLSKIPVYKDEGENLEVLNQDIAALLSNTKNEIIEDESWESKMYKDVIQSLSALQLAYNKQIKLQDDLGDSDETSQKLGQLKTENAQLQNQINSLQQLQTENAQLQSQIISLKSANSAKKDCDQIEKDLKDALSKIEQYKKVNKGLKDQIEKLSK